MSEYQLIGVPSALVDQFWHHAQHFIQAALDRSEGEMSIDDVRQFILDNDMQLWLVVEDDNMTGALVTRIIKYPNMTACRYVALGGDVHGDFETIDEAVSEWAKDLGCDRMEIVGRRGWTRAMKPMGYGEAYAHVTKRLDA